MTLDTTNHGTPAATVRELRLAARSINLFSPELITELGAALDDAAADDRVATVVISHAGKAFCAGTDLAHIQRLKDDPQALRDFLAGLVAMLRAVSACPKPTIAALDGPAVGGGFELALACDLRVMAEIAWVALPEVGFGALPGGGAVQSLARFVGHGRALDLILTGERLTARECEQLGLCRPVVTEGTARDAALALAGRIATGSLHAARLVKTLMTPHDDAVDSAALDAMVESLCGAEGREGLAALAAKRSADFVEARSGHAQ